jgi:hypothetical protein
VHALVNASLAGIGDRKNVNADWPAVHWLVANWPTLLGPPTALEQSLGDPTGLQWATYLYAIYLVAVRRAGAAGNWADAKNLATARHMVLDYAANNPPTAAAPIAICGTSIAHLDVASKFNLLQAPPEDVEAPEASEQAAFDAVRRAGGKSRRKGGGRTG